MGGSAMVAGGVYLLYDVGRYVLEIVWGLAKTSVDGQEEVLAQHSLDDVFRRTNHVVVLMSTFYLGQHHLVDIKGLVDDAYLLARLRLIPFREVGKHVFVYVVGPVIYLQNLLSVLLVVAGG